MTYNDAAAHTQTVFQSTLPLRGVTTSASTTTHATTSFQSTLPLRGVTVVFGCQFLDVVISIHTPLAGSDSNIHVPLPEKKISIHTPLAGSDQVQQRLHNLILFQSTLPLRGVTRQRQVHRQWTAISIHTPLAGSDSLSRTCKPEPKHFNPHSPCGE